MDALSSFYGALLGKPNDDVEDALLTRPHFASSVIVSAEPLLLQLLQSRTPALERLALQDMQRNWPHDNVFPASLWRAAVTLLGSDDLGVATVATQCSVYFATVAQLEASRELFEELAAKNPATHLRVLEWWAIVAAKGKPFHVLVTPWVERLVRIAEDQSDSLTALNAIATLMHVATFPAVHELLARSLARVRSGESDALLAVSLTRLAGAVARVDGSAVADWVEPCAEALAQADAVSESRLEAALDVLEGAAEGGNVALLCANGVLASVATLAMNERASPFARVAACHCLQRVLDVGLVNDGDVERVKPIVLDALHLSTLLRMARQPLLTPQRVQVLSLLVQCARRFPQWTTSPATAEFLAESADRDTLDLRVRLAQLCLADSAIALAALGPEGVAKLQRGTSSRTRKEAIPESAQLAAQ